MGNASPGGWEPAHSEQSKSERRGTIGAEVSMIREKGAGDLWQLGGEFGFVRSNPHGDPDHKERHAHRERGVRKARASVETKRSQTQ